MFARFRRSFASPRLASSCEIWARTACASAFFAAIGPGVAKAGTASKKAAKIPRMTCSACPRLGLIRGLGLPTGLTHRWGGARRSGHVSKVFGHVQLSTVGRSGQERGERDHEGAASRAFFDPTLVG